MKKLTIVCLLVLAALINKVDMLYGQPPLPNQDEQLASQYFQNKEFDKAVVYYEKLFNKKPNSFYYNYYLNCLLEVKDYKKAEKVVKRQIKQYPIELSYHVDLGNIYKTSGDATKAKEEFTYAVKQLSPNQEQIFNLAKAFVSIKELDFAIATYLRGRRVMAGDYPFSFELAEVYLQKGDLVAMTNEYLDVLLISDSYIQAVQNALQTSFGNSANTKRNEILKNELLKRVQKNEKTIYSELLIWMFIQQKEFDTAFTYAKALDNRKKEDGSRIISLAQIAVANESYEVAINCYNYLINKGSSNYYFVTSKMELLNVTYKRIIEHHNYTQADLSELEKKYLATIAELGKNENTVPLLKGLAHLQAFYLHKTDEAIQNLEEAIGVPKLSQTIQAQCKLELGDILLMTGDVWEASLKYSQVEKTFKNDPIGQDAKFRNAKVAYYTGDFKWAQAQLDVLKAATSKLIANDAMDLSLFISDNTVIDTSAIPLRIFARADLLSFQNKDDQAMVTLDSITTLFPDHALGDDILYKKSKIMISRGNFEEAAKYLKKIIDTYPDDILADDALFQLAELNENKFNDKEKAKELYQQLLLKYPGSLYTVEARKRFRKLRGDLVN